MTIRGKYFNGLRDLLLESPRLGDTCTKVEEVKEHWKKDQSRSALLGRWVWGQGNRGGLGKRFLLCLLIFDLVESPNDFNGEDA